QHLFGYFRGVDAVGGNQGNLHRAAKLGRDLGEGRARHLSGDGRNARLVPADTGIDDGRASGLDGLGQGDDFFPDAAALDQVEHRQTEDDDEVRAHSLAYAAHDLNRQAHAVLVAATPAVGALVGVGGEELVDEVAFRPHDLDAIVLGLLSQGGAIDEVLDLLLDALFIQFARFERVDRRLDSAWGHGLRAVGITTGVEDLHADLAARLVHGLGDNFVLFRFFNSSEFGCAGVHRAFHVRADTAGYHQADTAPGALGKIGGHPLEPVGLLLQAGVHGA